METNRLPKKFQRRCANCGNRAWIKIIYRRNKPYCKCPKCLAEGIWIKRI